VLSPAEEAIIVEFRRRTLLPLDDVMGCLRDAIPKLTRSALHRCLQRHGVSRLPANEEKASKRGRFAETTIGFVHIDSCELRLAEGRLVMFLAIDRVSKFTVVEFHDSAGKMEGAAFLRHVVASFPYAIHTVLTDKGMAFADLPKNRGRYPEIVAIFGGHIFDRVCQQHAIEHRLTTPYDPWTNGQAERMNRTIKDATTKAFHYPGRDALKAHVLAFVTAYNFAKHLKALRWRTPFKHICNATQRRSTSTRTTSSRDQTSRRVLHSAGGSGGLIFGGGLARRNASAPRGRPTLGVGASNNGSSLPRQACGPNPHRVRPIRR